jgi:NarL family two-component system response regulator LiaR
VNLRCLVADDHPALVQAIVDYLRGARIDVVGTAADGEHAVTLASELRPDVALVDFRMPRLAGPELLERLQEASPETRLVVYTADADETVVRSSLGAGATAIVLKEAPLADLLRALGTVVEGSTYVDPALAALGIGESGTLTLTDREEAVLALLAEGLSHDEIGTRLSISGETVRTHVRKACDRLGASTRTEAVAKALRLGLIA